MNGCGVKSRGICSKSRSILRLVSEHSSFMKVNDCRHEVHPVLHSFDPHLELGQYFMDGSGLIECIENGQTMDPTLNDPPFKINLNVIA